MDLDSNSLQAIAGQTSEQILPDAEKTAEAFKLFYTVVARLRAPMAVPGISSKLLRASAGISSKRRMSSRRPLPKNDNPHIEEETGDLYSSRRWSRTWAAEGRYTVADSLCEGARKLIRRHPHVFGESDVHSPDQVVRQWNEIKERVEGRRKKDSLLDEVHRHLPPLEKAYKLQKKAAKAGFDWQNSHDIWNKLEEELAELKQARAASEENAPDSGDALEEEFGDLLFTVINAARLYGIDPSIALHRANEKFSRRFRHVETRMKQNHLAMSPEYFEQMDAFWNEAKREEDAGETSSKVTKRQP